MPHAQLRATPLPAQTTLSGTVKTSSGSAIANSRVSIANSTTGETVSPAVDEDGQFASSGLRAGTYQVTAVAPGYVLASVTVRLGEGSSATAHLVLAADTKNPPAANNSASGEGLSAKAISELPLNGRSSTDAAALEPGVMRARTQASSGTGGFGNQMAIFGGRPRQNSSRLNGISVNDYANGPLGNAVSLSLGVDALDQLTVLTRNDQAEFGRSSGGYISSATRSGTTSYHGSVFEYFRDSHMDAADYFAISKPPFRRNQFGGSIGGPIFRRRLLFFATYEGLRQDEGTIAVIVVPSAAARTGILCSAPQLSGASCTPTALTGGVDPHVKLFLDKFYPVPASSNLLGNGDTGQVVTEGPRTRPANHFTTRVDYKPSARSALYGVYSFESGTNTTPDSFAEKLYTNATRQQYFTLGHNLALNSNSLNYLRIGMYRMVADVGDTIPGNNPLSGDPSFGFLPGRPHGMITVPGLTQLGNGLGGPDHYIYAWTSLQAYDDFSVTHGKQVFKFGFALERSRLNTISTANTGGRFTFNSFSDFLTNKPYSFVAALPGSDSGRAFRQTILGAYVQDDWLVRSNLSVAMGLRYEFATVPGEAHGKDTALANLTDATPQTGRSLFANPTLRNFSPRLGLSWDPMRSGFLVVSSGFGVFDVEPLPYAIQRGEFFSAPFYQTGSATNLPAGSFQTGAYPIAAASTTGFAEAYFEPNPKRNYVMQWNGTTQWRLPWDINVKVGYVGSRGIHHIFRVKDANMVLPELTSAGYLWPTVKGSVSRLNPNVGTITATFWNADSHYNAFVLQVRKQLLRKIQIGGSYTYGNATDTSSGSLDGDEYSNSISSPLWFDTRTNRGPSDFNVTHSLKITYSWQLANPRTEFKPVNWLLSGWQMGGVTEISSGVPFTPGFGGDPLGVNSTDTNVDVPSVMQSPNCAQLTNPGNFAHYVKTECLQAPRATPAIASRCVNAIDPTTNAPDTGSCLNLLGNLGRNSLTGPGLISHNITVFKNNYVRRISDVFNLQFRAEFFNLLNRPNVNAPLENKNIFDSKGNRLGSAGVVQSTLAQAPSRNIQLAVRVIW